MTTELSISGMTCAACVHNVESLLADAKGIKKVEVNLLLHSALVESNETLDIESINQVLKDFGYSASIKQSTIEESIAPWKLSSSLLLSGCIMLLSMIWMHQLLSQITQCILTILCLSIPCRHYFELGFNKMRKRILDMDTLIALGSSITFSYSLYHLTYDVFIMGQSHSMKLYFESAALIPTFVLLGKWIELKSKSRTSKELVQVLKFQERSWDIQREDNSLTVLSLYIRKGDIFNLVQGDLLPADACIIDGSVTANLSMLTGEPISHTFNKNEKLLSGTQIVSGTAKVKAEDDGAFSYLAKMMRNVEQVKYQKSKSEKYAEKWVKVFVPVIILLAMVSAILMYGFTHSTTLALETGVSVLVIACPCALGLAVPTAIAAGLGKAYQRGIMIRNPEVFEKFSEITDIVVDKTGTLTTGILSVEKVFEWNEKCNTDEWCQLKSVLSRSNHPLSKAYCDYITTKESEEIPSNWNESAGLGITAETSIGKWIIGSYKLMQNEEIDVSNELENSEQSNFYVALNGKIKQKVTFSDNIKSDAGDFVSQCAARKVKIHLLSGDNAKVVESTAKKLGIQHFKGECSPLEKQEYIRSFQSKGRRVLMLGDGLNDAQSIASADIGVSIGNKSEFINYSSDVVLTSHELTQFTATMKILAFTNSIIKQNVFWAFAYNALMIPLAGGLWYFMFKEGFSPMIASLSMTFSSVTVLFNTLRISIKNYND